MGRDDDKDVWSRGIESDDGSDASHFEGESSEGSDLEDDEEENSSVEESSGDEDGSAEEGHDDMESVEDSSGESDGLELEDERVEEEESDGEAEERDKEEAAGSVGACDVYMYVGAMLTLTCLDKLFGFSLPLLHTNICCCVCGSERATLESLSRHPMLTPVDSILNTLFKTFAAIFA